MIISEYLFTYISLIVNEILLIVFIITIQLN